MPIPPPKPGSDLAAVERVFYAHCELNEWHSGSGAPIDRDDPVFEHLMASEHEWFSPIEPTSVALPDGALDELREELFAVDPEHRCQSHAFAVTDPDGTQLGVVFLLIDPDSDAGYLLIDDKGKVAASFVDAPFAFLDDVLLPEDDE